MRMKQVARLLLVLFLFRASPAQPAGRTSYDAPPFQSGIWKQADAIDGLACQHLHWEAWKERYAKGRSACSTSCARLEAGGLVPCIGMQLWRNTYSSEKASPNSPASAAWVKWREDRPELLDRFGNGKQNPWGFISPAVTLDSADWPAGIVRADYGQWMADKIGRLCGFMGGVRGVMLSDFFDSHPHRTVEVHDFNTRVMDDFAERLSLSVPGSGLPDRADHIIEQYFDQWIDYWCEQYADFYSILARSIRDNHPENKGALIIDQMEFPVSLRRQYAIDPRVILQRMSPDNILFHWDAQRLAGHRRNYAPESCTPSILGVAAAREPGSRNGANMECDVKDFWDGIRMQFPRLSGDVQKEIGWKRLKRLWLETGWTHIADDDGTVRRAVCFFSRYYWDTGNINPDWINLIRKIKPARPFGPALYYSISIERAYEKRHKAYLGDWNRPITDLREAGVHFGYYVGDKALDSLKRDAVPAAWIVPDRTLGDADALPVSERTRLERLAPILSQARAKSPATPLGFSGGNRNLTGFGFIDQDSRLIILVSDRIEKGEHDNALPGTTAAVHLKLADGAYLAEELLSGERVPFTVKGGRGSFSTNLDRWDTKIFAVKIPPGP